MNTALSGPVSSLAGLTLLATVTVEVLPACWGLPACRLRAALTQLLQFCALTGSLSPWLPQLTSLKSLNLAANQARLRGGWQRRPSHGGLC